MTHRKSKEQQSYSAQDKGEASLHSDLEGKKRRLEHRDKSVNTNPESETLFTQNKTTSEERDLDVLVVGASPGSSTFSTETGQLLSFGRQSADKEEAEELHGKVGQLIIKHTSFPIVQRLEGLPFAPPQYPSSSKTYLQNTPHFTCSIPQFNQKPCEQLANLLQPLQLPLDLRKQHQERATQSEDLSVTSSVTHSQLPWDLSGQYQQGMMQSSSNDTPVASSFDVPFSFSQEKKKVDVQQRSDIEAHRGGGSTVSLPYSPSYDLMHSDRHYELRALSRPNKVLDQPMLLDQLQECSTPICSSKARGEEGVVLTSSIPLSGMHRQQDPSKDPTFPSMFDRHLTRSSYQERATQYSSKDPPATSVRHSQLPWNLSSPHEPISTAVQLSSDTNSASPYLPLYPHGLMPSDGHSMIHPLSRAKPKPLSDMETVDMMNTQQGSNISSHRLLSSQDLAPTTSNRGKVLVQPMLPDQLQDSSTPIYGSMTRGEEGGVFTSSRSPRRMREYSSHRNAEYLFGQNPTTHSQLPFSEQYQVQVPVGRKYQQGATQYSSNDPPGASSNYVPFPVHHHHIQEINERYVPLAPYTIQRQEVIKHMGSPSIIPISNCCLSGSGNQEIINDYVNGFCLVPSENEPGVDNKLPGGIEPPLMIERISATNTLPAHSNLQFSSTDSCWTRKMSNHLPHFHSIPSLSKLDVAKNNLTRAMSLPDMLLEDSFEEFTPDITVDENEETYSFHCSRPGLYQCSVTGLVFHMEGEGDVVYRIVSWNRRLLAQHHKKPAGPLFDIKCLQQQSVCQLHLPHCEIRSTGGCGFLSVAHVNDEGIEFITPHKITETHVIINITHFSGFGVVKDEDSPPGLLRALVLLFYRPPTDPDPESVLNVLLLPKNVVLRDVKRMRKKLVGDERYIETPGHCKLVPKQEYTLSTSPEDDSVLVQPTEAEFDEESYDNYVSSFQVNLEKIMKNIKLFLRDTNSSQSVWERKVCLLSTGVRTTCGLSALNLPSNERLMEIRTCFIDGISGPVLKSLLDKLFEKKVITDSERESAEGMQSKSDKARFVIDIVRKKGETASSEMIEFLCEVDPFLCEHLGLI